jgi:precorrin-3B C17-methyltransferase
MAAARTIAEISICSPFLGSAQGRTGDRLRGDRKSRCARLQRRCRRLWYDRVVFEVLAIRGWLPGERLDIEIIPGVSAGQAAAALLGAPLMHDFVCISLSDLLTPWARTATRLDKAAQADFVICLYNPASRRRTWQIQEAHRILLRHKGPQTPVGIVTNAYREDQRVTRTNLGQMLEFAIDMLTVVVIGNSETFVLGDRMVTPLGYSTD